MNVTVKERGDGERLFIDVDAVIVKPAMTFICRDGHEDEYVQNEHTTIVITD